MRQPTNNLIALALGFGDGWRQPYDLSTSTNVDHLIAPDATEDTVTEWLDRGINLGQVARAGMRSQAYVERYHNSTN